MRKTWLLLLIFIVALLAIGLVEAAPGLSNPGVLETHAEIFINGDAGFTGANGVRSGTGTEGDPYIISNWEIDANGTYGIRVRQTFKYYQIINCLINNTTYGFWIDDIRDGYGWVWNCEVTDGTCGLGFNIGNNITINETLVHNMTRGVYPDRTCGDVIIQNSEMRDLDHICYQADAAIWRAINWLVDNNTFENTASYGWYMLSAGQFRNLNVTISNNRFTNVSTQSVALMGSFHNILNNTFNDCSNPTIKPIIMVDFFNGTASGNYVNNGTDDWAIGISVRGPDNIIENNHVVNAVYAGIRLSGTPGMFNPHRTIVRNNTVESNYTSHGYWGLGGIYISEGNDVIFEDNIVKNHSVTGIGTDRYTNPQNLTIRNNHCENNWMYDYDIEHYTEGTRIYGNIAINGFFGFVIEGNDTLCFDNIARDCEIGFTIQGIGSLAYNNTLIDCRYGFVNFMDGHGFFNAQSTGNNTQTFNNIIVGGEYSFLFMNILNFMNDQYPSNCTIYNNTATGYSNTSFIFGSYDSDDHGGSGSTGWINFTNLYTNTYNTTNFIINSTSTHHLYCENITGNEFPLAVIWNSSGVIFHPPTSWERIRVQDITGNAFVDWTEGSVIFGAQEDHEYMITNNPVSDSSQSPDSVRDLLPFMMSVGVVIIMVGAIAYVVVRPFSEMSRRVRS